MSTSAQVGILHVDLQREGARLLTLAISYSVSSISTWFVAHQGEGYDDSTNPLTSYPYRLRKVASPLSPEDDALTIERVVELRSQVPKSTKRTEPICFTWQYAGEWRTAAALCSQFSGGTGKHINCKKCGLPPLR
jgi:hypothetical protein